MSSEVFSDEDYLDYTRDVLEQVTTMHGWGFLPVLGFVYVQPELTGLSTSLMPVHRMRRFCFDNGASSEEMFLRWFADQVRDSKIPYPHLFHGVVHISETGSHSSAMLRTVPGWVYYAERDRDTGKTTAWPENLADGQSGLALGMAELVEALSSARAAD